MKNLKYLLLIFLLLGCATVKKNTEKKEVVFNQDQTTISEMRKTIDSLSQKLTQIKSEKQKEVTKIEWRYTAPIVDTVFVNQKTPIWLKIGNDSVNVASLPSGSSLSAGNTNERTVEYYQSIIEELKHQISTAEGKTTVETTTKYVDREKLVEVERTAYNWYLFVGIFCLGLFTPEMIRFVINKMKPGI